MQACARYRFPRMSGDTAYLHQAGGPPAGKWKTAYTVLTRAMCSDLAKQPAVCKDVLCCNTKNCNA